MLRNVVSRCRNSRFSTCLCVASLCINVFLIVLNQHTRTDLVKYTVSVAENYRNQNLISSQNNKVLTVIATPANATSSGEPVNKTTKGAQDNATVCTLCPFDPPNLLGSLAYMNREIDADGLSLAFPDLTSARLKPIDCVARQRIAIIIPFRHRYSHLHIMLNNLIPVLNRQQADATFFVIEQAMPETFNRGALLNVGFLEAEKVHKFDCYIFHDVDLIPLDDRHLYRCGDNPKHFAVAIKKYNFKLPYPGYFGGVVGFSRRQFLNINGCSNVYFGWGGEDDDLNERVFNKGYIISRSPVAISRYEMIKHTRDKGNEANPVRKSILSSSKRRQDADGINTSTYKVNSIQKSQFYVWINVSLNRTDILQLNAYYDGGEKEGAGDVIVWKESLLPIKLQDSEILNSPSYILKAILSAQAPVITTLKVKAAESPQQKNESAHQKVESVHLNDESAHQKVESMHLNDESAHQKVESAHLNDESVHQKVESAHLNDESAHQKKDESVQADPPNIPNNVPVKEVVDNIQNIVKS